ncbi:hypothetical protein HSR122_3066 [Halapricum desulfuricans]|uniref:Uncharacterized protein n=1 Tax=Halapricum desulfuricans TaxID=2841257 RepID=A0A897NDE1_9EURY|nr:hypothetical protein HSR122_3066 [Halapricum desulfuricans]
MKTRAKPRKSNATSRPRVRNFPTLSHRLRRLTNPISTQSMSTQTGNTGGYTVSK